MVFEKTYNIIKNYFYKFSFQKFNKNDYLFIVDNNFEKYPILNVEYYNIKKIYIRYIPLFFFFDLTLSKKKYFINITETICPKKIISNNLNIFGYKFKNAKPNAKYYIYQHSYIYDAEFENFKKLYKNISVDIFFCFDERHKKIFSKILRAKFVIIGSFRNNYVKINNKKFFNRINYIAEYRQKNQLKISKNNEIYILKLLDKFCIKNNFSLFISLNSNRSDKLISKREEIKYYYNITNIFHYNNLNVYQNSQASIISISMSSNAGIEILSRGIPVIYFDLMSINNKNFKNPYFNSRSMFYLNKKISFEEFELNLNKIIDKIKNKRKLLIPQTIMFDQNNKIFNKYLKS